MAARSNSSITALLLGAVAVLLALNWKIAGMEVDTSPLADDSAKIAQALPATAPTDAERALGPLAGYRETLARPLFHPSRRPLIAKPPEAPVEVREEAPVEVPAGEASRLKLVGLIRAGGRAQRALLRLEGQPYGTWVDVGSEIEGWRLSSIDANKVLIEKNGGREELHLHAPTP